MTPEQTPTDLREGVRDAILSSIRRDTELRGGRTALRLVGAGLIGSTAAAGVTLLISGHPFDHHPPWHVTVVSSLWAGLLVVSFALVLLHVRTPSLSLERSAGVGILALGLAGICGALCPSPHFLDWWCGTRMGAPLVDMGGLVCSALCFGLLTTGLIALVAALVLLGRQCRHPVLPAAAVWVLLSPGVWLQSVDFSWLVAGAWLVGAAAGAYLGVAASLRLRAPPAPG